jgi:23S rRNA pseudouridine1911/1915/1917 synthase
LDIEILYEDQNFLAVNKPPGVLVHAVNAKRELLHSRVPKKSELSTGQANSLRGRQIAEREKETIVDWLLENHPEVRGVGDDPKLRPGIVHRLDRDTSGILLIAKNQKYFEYLKSLFQHHGIKKTYLAVVRGHVSERQGIINKPIGLKSGSVKHTVATARAKMVKNAVTNYRVKKYIKSYSEEQTLLEVTPETGRTHQIRVHLASIGHPVVGDKIYGGKKAKSSAPLYLHAYAVEFPVSPGRMIRIEADPPEGLADKLK